MSVRVAALVALGDQVDFHPGSRVPLTKSAAGPGIDPQLAAALMAGSGVAGLGALSALGAKKDKGKKMLGRGLIGGLLGGAAGYYGQPYLAGLLGGEEDASSLSPLSRPAYLPNEAPEEWDTEVSLPEDRAAHLPNEHASLAEAAGFGLADTEPDTPAEILGTPTAELPEEFLPTL